MSRMWIAGSICAVAVAAPISALAATPGPSAQASATKTIKIVDIAFKPSKVTVRKGSSVTWRFADGLTYHNVHSTSKMRFRSRDMKHGSFSVRFKHRGTYRYMCTLHPIAMHGTVVVR